MPDWERIAHEVHRGQARAPRESALATRHCIHVSLPAYSTISFTNTTQVLSKDVAVRKAVRDGFRIAEKPKIKSIGITLLLADELRGEKDIADIALLIMTSIRDFLYPGLSEILLHCSDEDELAVVKAVGMHIFGSLA